MHYPEKLSILDRTFSLVKDFAEKFPDDLATEKPDEKAFSANEIVYHLLEVEELWQRRLHHLLSEERPQFQQIDPDALAKEHHYNEHNYFEGIIEWQKSREDMRHLLSGLSDDALVRTGIHSRYGEINVYRIMDIIAEHDLTHLRQMERTLGKVKIENS
jgi:hypothetical protein